MKMENAAINNDILYQTAHQANLHALQSYDEAALLPSQRQATPAPALKARSNTRLPIWQQLKSALLAYCVAESNNTDLSSRVIQLGAQFTQRLTASQEYANALLMAKSEPQDGKPWLSKCLASDGVLQVNLETIFGANPTPLHNYAGPAGLIVVIEGNLNLTSYTEEVTPLTDCSLLSKLVQKTMNHLQPAQGALFNQDTGSIIEMHAQQNRCVFFNIYLKDDAGYPHYFYYPTYHSTSPDSLFTRRVKSYV